MGAAGSQAHHLEPDWAGSLAHPVLVVPTDFVDRDYDAQQHDVTHDEKRDHENHDILPSEISEHLTNTYSNLALK